MNTFLRLVTADDALLVGLNPHQLEEWYPVLARWVANNGASLAIFRHQTRLFSAFGAGFWFTTTVRGAWVEVIPHLRVEDCSRVRDVV